MNSSNREEAIARLEDELLSSDALGVNEVVENGCRYLSPVECVERLIFPALDRIGEKWESGEAALSQVYVSGRICEGIIGSMFKDSGTPMLDKPRIAVATLHDYHMLGMKLVSSALRASGFQSLDYGRMDVDSLVSRVNEDKVEVLMISVLMLPSALMLKELNTRLSENGSKVKVVVGGAPFVFDDTLAKEIGARYWGRSAADAVSIVRRIMREEVR